MNKQPLILRITDGMQRCVRPSIYWKISDIDFPELEAAKSVIQQDNKSVWQHSMSVLDLLTKRNSITLLSGLFHDLGKGYVQPMCNHPSFKFHGHEIESTRIARTKLTEWQASPYVIDRVTRLVLTHMYDISNALREKTVRKFVADVGQDNIENWFALRIADSQSYANYREYSRRLIKPFKIAVMSYLKQQPSVDQPKFDEPDTKRTIQIEGGDA